MSTFALIKALKKTSHGVETSVLMIVLMILICIFNLNYLTFHRIKSPEPEPMALKTGHSQSVSNYSHSTLFSISLSNASSYHLYKNLTFVNINPNATAIRGNKSEANN